MSKRFVILIILALAGAWPAVGQVDTTRAIHLNADSLFGDRLQGQQVRRLVGSVRLRQGPTRLRSARATQYVDRDEIFFEGRVRITERGDTLWADEVTYDTREKVGLARGSVVLSDGTVRVGAPAARYWADEKRSAFSGGVRLVDSVSVLTSDLGTYWSDRDSAAFYGRVALRDSQTIFRADTLGYQRERRRAYGFGDVRIDRIEPAAEDSVRRRIVAFAERAFTDEVAGTSALRGDPLLVQIDLPAEGQRPDTLLLRALRIDVLQETDTTTMTAVDSVRIRRGAFAALADSARVAQYENADQTEWAQLLGSPLVWHDATQISADTLQLHRYASVLDTLDATGNAFAARLDSALSRVHQLSGRTLRALIDGDSLRAVRATPNARAIYFLSTEAGALDGAVQVSADSIQFRFQGEQIERIAVRSGVEGTRYPESELPTPFQLEGYLWVPERRPSRADLLPPQIRLDPPRFGIRPADRRLASSPTDRL